MGWRSVHAAGVAENEEAVAGLTSLTLRVGVGAIPTRSVSEESAIGTLILQQGLLRRAEVLNHPFAARKATVAFRSAKARKSSTNLLQNEPRLRFGLVWEPYQPEA